MAKLTKEQIEAIFESLKEIDEFKIEVLERLSKRKLDGLDISEIESKLAYIASNTEYIVDLLSPDE